MLVERAVTTQKFDHFVVESAAQFSQAVWHLITEEPPSTSLVSKLDRSLVEPTDRNSATVSE